MEVIACAIAATPRVGESSVCCDGLVSGVVLGPGLRCCRQLRRCGQCYWFGLCWHRLARETRQRVN